MGCFSGKRLTWLFDAYQPWNDEWHQYPTVLEWTVVDLGVAAQRNMTLAALARAFSGFFPCLPCGALRKKSPMLLNFNFRSKTSTCTARAYAGDCHKRSAAKKGLFLLD